MKSLSLANKLRSLRNGCAGIGVLSLLLACSAVENTTGNPKAWVSAFDAMASAGFLTQYAASFAEIGLVFLLLALLLSLGIRKKNLDN